MFDNHEKPSINSLVAFVETIKYGSMTKAATALGISQPLVSQRIRSLEECVGGVLVNRSKKPIIATQEGMKFFAQIEAPLSAILGSTEALKVGFRHTKTKISIAAYFGFAFHWIMPRLQRLQEAFPHYLFEILPTNSQADLFAFESDIVFHYAERLERYQYESMFLHEQIFPVCSPNYAARKGLVERQTLCDLDGLDILHKDVDDARWPNWQGWAKLTGVKPSLSPISVRYNNYPLVVEACVNGLGLCLGWGGLVDSYIAEGKLIPLKPSLSSDTRGYFLCSNHHQDQTVRSVIEWLEAEARQQSAN